MTDKQIIGGRGSAKPYTTLNTIEVMLENEDLKEQLKTKEQECEELKKVNRHIEHSRTQKADKLMRTEKLITACSTGYTDEFIQELLVILHEPEPIKE